MIGAADIATATQTVDQLAGKSIGWLLIASVLVIVVGGGFFGKWVIKYLMGKLDERDQKLNAVQERHEEKLEEIISKKHEMDERIAVCLDRNTDAMDGCTDFMRRMGRKF